MSIFTTSIEGSTLMLEVHGPVSSLTDDSLLKEVDGILAQLRQGTAHDIVVDFGQSPYFGSAMLETLRRVWNDVQQHGGRMIVCNLSTVGNEILQVSKFDQLWPIVATRTDAVKKLKTKS